jgi:hypothetical protein
MVPILAAALQRAGARQVLVLCSGAAGPWLWLQPLLAEREVSVSVCLTDKYPNVEASRSLKRLKHQSITYHPQSVDATSVSAELSGFRTIFSAFHHFPPEQARAVLADAVRKRQGIAVVEGTQNSILALLLMLLVPLMVLLMTPFIRPFRWSRLFWTYLIPVMPLIVLFDGLVSCLRTYNVEELRDLVASLDANDYLWDIGTAKVAASPIPITFLIGVPADKTGSLSRQAL